MSYKKTREKLIEIAKEELALANDNNPQFRSWHEAVAVLYEEAEEARDELNEMMSWARLFWAETKKDDPHPETLRKLRRHAISTAAEAIQTAAMAAKALQFGKAQEELAHSETEARPGEEEEDDDNA